MSKRRFFTSLLKPVKVCSDLILLGREFQVLDAK